MKQSKRLETASVLIFKLKVFFFFFIYFFFKVIETFIVHNHDVSFNAGTKQIGMKHFVSKC